MLQKKLNNLKGQVIQFSSLIEQMIDKSIRGLTTKDQSLLDEVIQINEPSANKFELKIDDICTSLIAQYNPMAKDLRTILMIYNMNTALERMGDHGVNIAESASELIVAPLVKPFIDIPRMNEIVKEMLNGSINSFINEDPSLAKDICQRDSIIDGLRDQVTREIITFMASNPSIIGQGIHILRIAENLERIADLTTNICEDVIFMSQGEVIKHGGREKNRNG
jgi:phosphate transport system protein